MIKNSFIAWLPTILTNSKIMHRVISSVIPAVLGNRVSYQYLHLQNRI